MVDVRDDLHILTSAQKHDLEGQSVPFTAHVVYKRATKPALESEMRTCVATQNTLCIGINPIDRFINVQFGADVSGAINAVAIRKAGNADFKENNWADGAKSILGRAASLHSVPVQAGSRAPTQNIIVQPIQTQVVHSNAPAWPWILVFAALVGGLVWYFRKKAKKLDDRARDLTSETADVIARNQDLEDKKKYEERQQAEIRASTGRPPASYGSPTGNDELQAARQEEARRQSQKDREAAERLAAIRRSQVKGVMEEATMASPRPAPRDPPSRPQTTPPQVIVQQQVVQQPAYGRSSSDDLLTGVLIGEALASRPVVIVDDDRPVRRHHRRETPVTEPDITPEPVMVAGGTEDMDDSSESVVSDSGTEDI